MSEVENRLKQIANRKGMDVIVREVAMEALEAIRSSETVCDSYAEENQRLTEELDRLKHDIERYVTIASEEATRASNAENMNKSLADLPHCEICDDPATCRYCELSCEPRFPEAESDILVRIRKAFDGDDVVQKNIALRKAYDEIERLRKESK